MIYLYFLIDYIVMLLLPINVYFVVWNIDKNKLYNVIFVGFLIDIMYHKLLLYAIVLLLFYYLSKKIKIKKEFYLIKNIVIYLLFYYITNYINV